jgi:hypothetical protein
MSGDTYFSVVPARNKLRGRLVVECPRCCVNQNEKKKKKVLHNDDLYLFFLYMCNTRHSPPADTRLLLFG